MKNKLPIFNEDFENITGGFGFYLNNESSPILIMNKDEIEFISNNSNEILTDFYAVKASFGNCCNSDVLIFIVKQYLEAGGFKNTYEGEF